MRAKKVDTTHGPIRDRLRGLLSYDPETGDITWRVKKYSVKAGDLAGSIGDGGYRLIRVDGRLYLAHRVAWLLSVGEWPKGQIDHIDGVKTNNRLINLRDVDASVNAQNMKGPRRDNRTGMLGVSINRNAYVANIGLDGKIIYLGRFRTAQLAHDAYLAAKRRIHPGNTL